MRTIRMILTISLVLTTRVCMAEETKALQTQAAGPPLEVLDEVLVTGTQPGPPLWQVKSGNNVLWVFALVPYVSKDIKWRSEKVETVLTGTREVLAQYGTGYIPPPATPTLSKKDLAALLNQTRYLPDGQTLRDVLPSELHARFQTAIAAFPARDKNMEQENDLERSRPLWAANLLWRRAWVALKLGTPPVTEKIADMAKRKKVKITSVEFRDWAGYVAPFPATIEAAMDECRLDEFLQNLEGRGSRLKARANAWAVGDVKRLTQLVRPPLPRIPHCEDSEAKGTDLKEKWLTAMERSLANNSSTLAVVDASLLLSVDGLLDTLRSRGYEVVDP